MSKLTIPEPIDPAGLPFGATVRERDGGYEVEADVSQADLQAAVDGYVPPEPDEALPTYAELVAEVRGIKERTAAATVTGDAAKIRDAVAGPKE